MGPSRKEDVVWAAVAKRTVGTRRQCQHLSESTAVLMGGEEEDLV